MNIIKVAVWHTAWAVAIALCGGAALAGEVTAVGAPPAAGDQTECGTGPTWLDHAPASAGTSSNEIQFKYPATSFASSLYTNLDYFYRETGKKYSRVGIDSDSGILYTLGFAKRIEAERFRVELFAGNMLYAASGTASVTTTNLATGDVSTESINWNLRGRSAYFGGRIECEHLWTLDVDDYSPLVLYAGLGTRVWHVGTYDQYEAELDLYVQNEEQVWWTIYPYVGSEKRWPIGPNTEIFAGSRIGVTAINYLHTSDTEWPGIFPTAGLTAQLECGIQRNQFFISAFFESIAFGKSSNLHIQGMPSYNRYTDTRTYIAGARIGYNY